ncbi:hypothetical protein H9635_04780 [Solibacillus sp. A46]|uniref:Uncharacterized protein n=1 Tax=Solibacillus faecavium TaxID=2762221 RepID=A0ABR8XVT0_9BACL|nr:hypothetical protein [Solibacillus faecavium]MBD8036046.1 hypothetical protein [Solibacillus faecavium]
MKAKTLNNLLFSKSTQPYVNVINLKRLTILTKQAFMEIHECLLLFYCLCSPRYTHAVFYFILESLMIEFGQNDYNIQHIPQEELQRLIIELGYLEWEIDDRHVLIAEMAG